MSIFVHAETLKALQNGGQRSTLEHHVRTIENGIANRSVSAIRDYLHPKKTFIDIFGKPAAYLSVNQALAVIETFMKEYVPSGYSQGVVKEGAPGGVSISTLRVRSSTGIRSVKLILSFSREKDEHWVINRIVVR